MTDPTKDPNFSAVKQPVFDSLVGSHGRAGPALDRMADQLELELRKLGVDTSPSVRIRRLAALVNSEAADLRRRQGFVKNMDKPGGSPVICTTKGTFWQIPVGRPGGEPDLSYELNGAEGLPLPNVDPGGTRFTDAQDAVLAWIEIHRDKILREARARGVPPEAITSAIAWEAIQNNDWRQPVQWPIPPDWPLGRRGTGPGKFHVNDELAQQLEDQGYVPPLSVPERDRVLSTPEGSAKYIAAAMRAFSDVTDQYRKEHPESGVPSIRHDVLMLTQLYHGSDLEKWRHRLETRPPGPLQADNDMPEWVKDNPEFLAGMREALHSTAPPPEPVESWIPPGASPTPPTGQPQSPGAPAPAPGQSPSPRN